MGLVVNTNVTALTMQRNLASSTTEIGTYMERLSTGLRINSAVDDAAGLALSESLESQISASNVAKTNIQTGINMLQTLECDASVVQDALHRMRDLAVQAANGVYSGSERDALQAELSNLSSEITRIANSSEFSGQKLMNGSLNLAPVNIQVGANSGDVIDINVKGWDHPMSGIFESFADYIEFQSGGCLSANLSTQAGAQTAITSLGVALEMVSGHRTLTATAINRLESTLESVDVRKENLVASNSIIRDADIAVEAASLTRTQILQQASASLLQQANQAPSLALSLL